MEIVENMAEWSETFEQNWLAHFRETGETVWKIYNRAKNSQAPGLPGIHLPESRILLISSAGAYLKDGQEPYDAADDLGDYSIRLFDVTTPFDQLDYAHDHYDQTAVKTDPQVLLPLAHLQEMAAAGVIGDVHEQVISFHGYQPDVRRIVGETIPAILAEVDREKVDGVLLVPA